jgi:two-component system, OmpR family, sensor kinase
MTRSRPRRTLLRTRVLAGVLSITLVALAGFDVAAGSVLRRYLVGQTDSALQRGLNLARPQLPLLLARIESGRPPMPVRLLRILGEYYLAFVSDSGSTVILESDPSLAPRLPADLPVIAADHSAQTVAARDGHGELRLRAMPAYGGTLVVTAYLDVVNRTVTRLRLIVTVGSAAAGLLIALGVVLVLRRGLRPLETMAIQADRITAGDLTERVSLADGASEVGRLGVALNGMLARIEAAVTERKASEELTQRFFADASHELRTPLAALRATAELYQQGALLRRAQVDEAMRRIGVEARRMSRLVDDMLRLARLDQRPAQQSDPVDLTALAEGCAERARIADPRRTWPAHIAAGLVAVGDEELLRRAIDNLLANVRAHTPAGTVATMTVAGRGSSVIVEVSDNGPGVPADRLPRIFDRFYRAGSQGHEPGSGLGLAIVAEIATAHKGTAEATLNDPHGLRVTLTLPAGSEGHRAGQEPPPVQAK